MSTDVIDRVNRLEVYNQLLKTPYLTVSDLSKALNKSYEDIELYIASLRKMYKEGEIDKYVSSSPNGYYLVDKIITSDQNLDYDSVTTEYNAIDLKNLENQKFEKSKINLPDNKDSNDTLVLDLKKQLNNDIGLLKINVVDENDVATFSLTISIS